MAKMQLGAGYRMLGYRKGADGFPGFGGMETEGDYGGTLPPQLRYVENARLRGGAWEARMGLAKLNSSAVFDGSNLRVLHMYDYQILAPPLKLWIVGDGCPGVSSSSGGYVAHMDIEQNPEFQRAVNYASTANVIIAKFGEDIYVGTDSQLRRFGLILQPWGTENITISGSTQDTPIATFSGFTITCMQEFDGKLFIGLDNGAGASKIVTYDGVSIITDISSINAPTCFGKFRITGGGDAIVVGFGSGTNAVKVRPTGAAPGWTNYTPGAGTLGALGMVSYKDVLYIASSDGAVWTWTGAVLASAHTAAGTPTACRAVCTFNGYLYFAYETSTAALIGKYDGSSWTDAEKNITTQTALTTSIRALASYRGSLYAAGTVTGVGGKIWVSPGTTTSGTYTVIVPNATNNGEIFSLVMI